MRIVLRSIVRMLFMITRSYLLTLNISSLQVTNIFLVLFFSMYLSAFRLSGFLFQNITGS